MKVAVVDAHLDEQFEIHVAGAHALDAFHHPFAYAAGLGCSFGERRSRRGPRLCTRKERGLMTIDPVHTPAAGRRWACCR